MSQTDTAIKTIKCSCSLSRSLPSAQHIKNVLRFSLGGSLRHKL
jgi:hypothetical protein